MVTGANFFDWEKSDIQQIKNWLEFAASKKDYEDEVLNELIKDLAALLD